MAAEILIGRGKEMEPASEQSWRTELRAVAAKPSPRLQFMSPEHHLVRDTVVRELPRQGVPLPPAWIAATTGLPENRVRDLLDELEARLFFLVRDDEGAVSWAYPVTMESTPHRLRFRSGETLFAA